MIVVTGAGIISAIGNDKAETLSALIEGRSGIGPIRYLNTIHKDLPVGEVQLSNEEMAARLGVACTHQTSRTTLMGTLALKEALQQAGLTPADLPQTALVSGTTVGNMDRAEKFFNTEKGCEALGDCGKVTEEMAAMIGRFGFTTTCSTACSSAANAFILGANLLRSGLYERVVVGGSECLSK
ncbi:MAG: beta-ketoacyl-[acyl-carrier-protein] synthase family protein, partial [Prevotella sp.]